MLPVAAYAVGVLLRGQEGRLAFLQDDASYYLVIAENLVRSGRSSFDGMTTTTGYHPLWLALNTALAWLTGLNLSLYVVALIGLCALLALLHAAALRCVLQRLTPVTLAVDVVVVVVVTRSLNTGFSGMECAVAMPVLALCTLETLRQLEDPIPQPRRIALLGLLAAAAGLSRIDAAPFGLVCGALVVLRGPLELRALAKRLAAFGLGLLPLAGYFTVHRILMGSILTTSARAKSLNTDLAWNTEIFDNLSRGERFGFVYLAFAGALLVYGPFSPWRGPRRKVAMLITGFPIAYYGFLALRSSWQIWSWYTYPLPLASAVAIVAGVELIRQRLPALASAMAKLRRFALPAALAISMLLVLRVSLSRGNNEGTLHAASALLGFAAGHPGRYAMGDRAGLTALLVGRSFLQLEGLVADAALLEAIREQRNLRRTLAEYSIDYLVEAVPTDSLGPGPCQEFSEPKLEQSGAHSPKMRATFCNPVFRFDDDFDFHTTLVYAVPRDGSSRL